MASDHPTPLVHVGYHKTATTWLQQSLFVDAGAGFISWDRDDLLERIVLVPPFGFDPKATRSFFTARLAEAATAGLVPAFSHERLCGNPHSGGYDAPLLGERLAAVLPSARILIVIREQKRAIASCYKQYVTEGGPQSVGRYLDPPRSGRARIPLFRFSHFEYHHLIGHYQRLFGRENVLVLAYESLQRDPDAFAARITSFAGANPEPGVSTAARHVSPSALAAALQRPANFLLVRDTLNPTGRLEGPRSHRALRRACAALDSVAPRALREACERRLQERVNVTVADRYRASNRSTRDLTGIDLGDHGYDL
jgi:hypothetical protein